MRLKLFTASILLGVSALATPPVNCQAFAPMFLGTDDLDLDRPLVSQLSRDKDAWLDHVFKPDIIKKGLVKAWNSLPYNRQDKIIRLAWECYVDRLEQEAEEQWFTSNQASWTRRDVQVWNSLSLRSSEL